LNLNNEQGGKYVSGGEYEAIQKRRKKTVWTDQDKAIITEIEALTWKGNVDNIARTHAYQEYYLQYPHVQWALLASMVSRNAGWNMTDLEGKYYPKMLSKDVRKRLFLTYERANWFIFSDAYPQLLVYAYSIRANKALFHLLQAFSVSVFMEREWELFWNEGNENRMMTALIINEQHMIQKPVIEHPYFKKHVFDSVLFKFQELLHFSAVLFPTVSGKLYGFSVHDFVDVHKRIELGKRLAWLLFHPEYNKQFEAFAKETVHTGSRMDYEQYFLFVKEPDTPILRDVYPIIPHQRHKMEDWFSTNEVLALFDPVEEQKQFDLTDWFLIKQKQLHVFSAFEQFLYRDE
jgi:hypothetical protein